MIPKDGIDLPYLKAAVERRFWYVVLSFFVIFLAAVVYCIVTPRSYKAHTVILVEPQKVPREFVSPTVTVGLETRLRTIIEEIKSRTRLERIINEYDLYPGILASATMTDAVTTFRNHIDVNVRGGLSFEVAFEGTDPVKVRDVTNTLADIFIENNLKLREAQATATTSFLDRELKKLQGDLQGNETAIRQFKEKYRGFLPGDMRQNETMLAYLQGQLDSVNATIEQTKDRKILVETQLKNLERMESQSDNFGAQAGNMLEEELRAELKNLKARYSGRHPDVRKLEARITRLGEEQEVGSPDGDRVSLFEAQKEDVSAQVRLIARELDDLQLEKNKIKGEMETYRHRIESGLEIEQMLTDLSRGYDVIRINYDSLLQKKYKAEIAENLERAQQSEQFTVLDPAKLPDRPFKPQARKVLLHAFFLALAAGLGLACLREYLDTSFFSVKEIETRIQIPVLASIPLITTDRDRRGIMVKRALSATAMVSMASILLYALYFLWKMDPTLRTTLLG